MTLDLQKRARYDDALALPSYVQYTEREGELKREEGREGVLLLSALVELQFSPLPSALSVLPVSSPSHLCSLLEIFWQPSK